ncbi:MAG: peptide chain release factor 1 [Acidimicrobiia bacterium]|nr:peptide chain release factor 1 [Acidimicrobiia bacterium]
MLRRLETLENELADVEARLGDPDLISDQTRFQIEARRHKELDAIVSVGRQLRSETEELEAARDLFSESEGDDREIWRGEVTELEEKVERSTAAFRLALLPKDPNDDRNAIVEIRGAEGGEEANLFARDLYDMFKSFAGRQGWKFELMEGTESDMGGFTTVTFSLSGEGVWSRMKFEAGVHRVQRVPKTESQGRVHTSSATVSVLPEAEEVDVHIDENDLQIDVYRASGPGGQSVNTTDSAVRITHLPSGVVVSMQDEKSQLQNKAKALRVLRSRILQAEQDRQAAEASEQRKSQMGGGGRSEKIRTYNFKENRVSDHRIGLTVHNLDKVLAGELDTVSDALLHDDQQRRLAGDDV